MPLDRGQEEVLHSRVLDAHDTALLGVPIWQCEKRQARIPENVEGSGIAVRAGGELTVEPGPGESPEAVGAGSREAEGLGGLLDRKPGKAVKSDESGGDGILGL